MINTCHTRFNECEQEYILSRISEMALENGNGLCEGVHFFDEIFNSEGDAVKYLKSKTATYSNVAVRYKVVESFDDKILQQLQHRYRALMTKSDRSFGDLRAISEKIDERFEELAKSSNTIKWLVRFSYDS